MTVDTFGASEAFAPPRSRSGFLARLGASFLDGIILLVPLVILTSALRGPGYVLALILQAAYFIYFEGNSGQTLGKRAASIRVVDPNGERTIGYPRAFVRWIGRYISALPLYLGYLWMLWDGEKQTWHDKLARCVVIPTESLD